MPNGTDYILFYLKLLCESVDHEGGLRFSEQIPYNEEMLGTITNTNVDIVRSAVKVFTELGMMDILDDGTYFMNEVQKMIGSASNTDVANRVRRHREKQKLLAETSDVTKCNADVTESVTNDNESKSKNKNKSKSKNNIYREEFEECWKLYPKKLGSKEKAYEAYVKARKEGTTKADVIIGINNYKAYVKAKGIDDQYVAYGQTFFTQKRWENDYTIRNNFNDIENHEYDFDQLEKELLYDGT